MNQKKNNTGKGIVCLILLLVAIAVSGFFAADTLNKSKLVTDENGVTMFQDGGIKLQNGSLNENKCHVSQREAC